MSLERAISIAIQQHDAWAANARQYDIPGLALVLTARLALLHAADENPDWAVLDLCADIKDIVDTELELIHGIEADERDFEG